ncbi:MAG: hypothetical protein HY722_12760 [Planctomycetes bacterium]|nr:hypothetical protein [Planctomycetota bacterium]
MGVTRRTVAVGKGRAGVLALGLALAGASVASAQGGGPAADEGARPLAVVLPIRDKDEIDLPTAMFVRRCMADALRMGARVVVVEVDTPGGEVFQTLDICRYLNDYPDQLRTAAFVTSIAWSAGSLISIACDSIYMREGTSMGSAVPVAPGAEGAVEALGEKYQSAVRAAFRSWAEKKGRSANLAQAMVDPRLEILEVVVQGERRFLTRQEVDNLEREGREHRVVGVVCPEGQVLNVTATEAVRLGLANGVAASVEELLRAEGFDDARVLRLDYTLGERLAELVYAIRILFLVVGLVGLYTELKVPGFGIPGILGLASLAVFFGSSYLVGTAHPMEIVAFFLGVVLLAVELFVTPGFGVLGVLGLVLMAASVLLAMQPFDWPQGPMEAPEFEWQWDLFRTNLLQLTLGTLGAVGLMAALAVALPRTRLARGILLEGPAPGEVRPAVESPPGLAPGDQGIAVTVLRPVGKAEFAGRMCDVVAEGDLIECGTPVEVVSVAGMRVLVRAARGEGTG